MKSIRILQVVTIMNRGGLETMLMNYYRRLCASGIQFDFMVHREEEGHYDAEIRSLGGKIYRMPAIRPGNYRKYFKALDDFFRDHPEYRVVHAHINENSSFVMRAAAKAGVPCRIMHSHLSDLGFDYKYPFRLYARLAMRRHPSDYFACSVKAGEWLFGKRRQTSERVTVLNNAVDAEGLAYNPDVRSAVRTELGVDDRFVIGHVGRFNEQKNHKFVLQVFEYTLRREPSAMLLLAGDGSLRPAIEREVQRRGLSEHVRFLGVRDDVYRLMQSMDLFLFPSLFEGLPVVLIEAQAAGLMCVVSDRITAEVDVTGRVAFHPLEDGADRWGEAVLRSPRERADTRQLLKDKGYDTATMADWLRRYYIDGAARGAAASRGAYASQGAAASGGAR